MPMPAMMGSHDGTGGSSHRRPASATDRTADNCTSDGAAPRGTLSHDIVYGHDESQHQENRPEWKPTHM